MFKTRIEKQHIAAICMSICLVGLPACATKPDRRGSQKAKQRSAQSGFTGVAAKPVGLLFMGMDKDADARLTLQELQKGIELEWAFFGTQRKVSAIQFSDWSVKALGSTSAMPSFFAFDADFNGIVSKAEFTRRLENEFLSADKNLDEVVTRSELTFEIQSPRGRGGQQGNPKRDKKKGRRGPPP